MTPVELWLPVGALAFYLYDSVQPLWQNELLFIRAGSRWTVAGDSRLRRWGRRMVMPNPLLPHRAQFKVAWSPDDTRSSTDTAVATLLPSLRPLGFLCTTMLWLMLLLVPVCWLLGAGLILLLQFAAYYLLVIAALVLVFRRRQALGLPTRAFWALCLDALACAPFAANLVRRISLRHGLSGDPIAFAAAHFDAAARHELERVIRSRLEETQAGDPPTPDRQQQIAQWLSRLEHSVT